MFDNYVSLLEAIVSQLEMKTIRELDSDKNLNGAITNEGIEKYNRLREARDVLNNYLIDTDELYNLCVEYGLIDLD